MVYQVSDIYPLHSGRQTRSLATTLCMSAKPDILIRPNVKSFFTTKHNARLHTAS